MYSSSLDSKLSGSSTPDAAKSPAASRKRFVFPPAPAEPRLCRSVTNSTCSRSDRSDSSVSDGMLIKVRKRSKRKSKPLIPIGVFWDIENCQVPKSKSASSIVQRIRELFFSNYTEAEFIVVCDVKKESTQIVQELNDSQVNLIHVSSTSKNAADEKLRQSLRRFAEIYKAPAAVALISGDVNFAADLSDLRYRRKMHVILIHNTNVADALILCANETYSFSVITDNLPEQRIKNLTVHQVDLFVSNLPTNCENGKIKNRLHFLCNNCGGRVVNVNKNGQAVVRFSSLDFAKRAQRRMQGEDVFGNKIKVSNPTPARESPHKNFTGRKMKTSDTSYQVSPFSVQQSSYPGIPDIPLYNAQLQSIHMDVWKSKDQTQLSQIQDVPSVPQFLTPQLNQVQFRPIRGAGALETSFDGGRRLSAFVERRCQTPQAGACSLAYQDLAVRSHGPQSDSSDEARAAAPFQLMRSVSSSSMGSSASQQVDLVISNLDPAIEMKEMRKILINMLKQYVMVLSLSISTQTDGSSVAMVRVGSQQEAQYAISQLHRQKLGHRRITITYGQSSGPDLSKLRTFVVSLLKEVPGYRMPLFKFVSLLETRYHLNVSVSDLYKLRDICKITDIQGGRMIMLQPEMRNSPVPKLNETLTMYCYIHCPNGLENRGWGEADVIELPNMRVSLKAFAAKVCTLLTSHSGILPLLSFQVCYETEFREPLPTDESGVPLEHIVTCVKGVELKRGGPNKNIKYLQMRALGTEADQEENVLKSLSPNLVPNVLLLCRELVDLLKTYDRCLLPLNKFIPAYHHHFGRQCRVADYGFTKLADLFELVSHVVQILGEGAGRILTLSHTAQMRRFNTDLGRVLKGQQSKQVTLCDFPFAYERTLNKPFNPVEYGLCTLEDLLSEQKNNENTVIYTRADGQVIIAIPKREPTAEEMARTKKFASEVIELLRHAPNCSMLFNKFVPAYHHHFGHQCKVSDYGCSKLIELFEAIPDTVKVEDLPSGERKITLLLPIAMKVLGTQIRDLMKHLQMTSLTLDSLPGEFLRLYGYPLKPQAYECSDIEELISKLDDYVEILNCNNVQPLVVLRQEEVTMIEIRVWSLLVAPPHCMKISVFIHCYRVRFQTTLSMSKLEQLSSVVKLSSDENETFVSLTPLYVMAAQIYHLLVENKASIPINNLSGLYLSKYGRPLRPSDYNFQSLEVLLNALAFVVVLRRSRRRCNVILNKELAAYGLEISSSAASEQGKEGRNKENSTYWPPPPHSLLNNVKGVSPPKPDTPNAEDLAPWNSVWETPSKLSNDINLCIPLPPFQTPKLLTDPNELISPTRTLLSAHSHLLNAEMPVIAPPHPHQLPMPNKLIESGCFEDDLNDSGVINTFSQLESDAKDVQNTAQC